MKNEEKIKKFLLILGALLLVSVFMLFVVDQRKGTKNENKNGLEGTLTAEPSSLSTYPLNLENIKIFFAHQGKVVEVTEKTTLMSSNPEMLNVSMDKETYGQVVAQRAGDYSVRAVYEGKELDIPVKVKEVELKIECKYIVNRFPVLVEDKVSWLMMFEKIGTPRYTYSITGSDGLNSEEPLAEIVYKTPGQKIVKMEAVDYTGKKASVECDPLTVMEKK